MADVLARTELIALNLPYQSKVQFRSSQGSSGVYALLRLTTRDGAQGIAEVTGIANVAESDPKNLAAQFDQLLGPLLEGEDPLDHNRLLVALDGVPGTRIAKALIDVALWDLKGKLLGQPVWRLLGGGPAQPVPVAAILFGDEPSAMLEDAERSVARGLRALKVKLWRHSSDDVELVRDIRKAVGDDVLIYADANHSYSESEARELLPKLAEFDVAMVEDPCKLPAAELAALGASLPIPILSEIPIQSLATAHEYVRSDAAGALSLHVRRTGITDTLKIAALSEAAGLPAIVGTDLEAHVGVFARLSLRAAIPSLEPWPAEIGFFERLAGDVLAEPLAIVDGAIAVPDRPGFGATIDEAKLERFRL